VIRSAYGRVARDAEDLRMEYLPTVKGDLAVALAQNRDRDRALRTTLLGPHRDDLGFWLDGRPAAPYASEGQKRTLAIALKMAQAEYLTGLHGTPPILLIDDVMGELDLDRRSGFLPLLDRSQEASGQVFMTCTEETWPRELGSRLQRWHVENGSLDPRPEAADGTGTATTGPAGADQGSDRSTKAPSGGNVSSAENGC
jgi:DNA replication and repair protein RecF